MRRCLTLFLTLITLAVCPPCGYAQEPPPADATVGSSSPGDQPVIATANTKVAILDFFNLSNQEEYDRFETLWGRGVRRAAFAWKKFVVIPFPRIHTAIEELRIDDYFIAPEQTPEMGKLLEADLFVLGTFNVSNGVLASSVKLVDAKTGRQLNDETRFGSIDKPDEFLVDLIETVQDMLLGKNAQVETPALPSGEASDSPPPAPAATGSSAPPPSTSPAVPAPSFDPFAAPPSSPPAPAVRTVSPPAPALVSPPPVSPPPPVAQPAVVDPWGPPPVAPAPPQPRITRETLPVDAIEAQIPPLKPPTSDTPAQVGSPFQPLPVLPAPPPSRPMFAQPPPMPQPGLQQPGMQQPGMQQPMGPIAQGPTQPGALGSQPMAPQEISGPQPSPVRRFFSAITRPFRPAPGVGTAPIGPEPGVAVAPQPPAPGTQMSPAPPPAPEPAGNPVTRFFGRVFGGGE